MRRTLVILMNGGSSVMAFNAPAKMVGLVGNAGVYKSKLSVFQFLIRGWYFGNGFVEIYIKILILCIDLFYIVLLQKVDKLIVNEFCSLFANIVI